MKENFVEICHSERARLVLARLVLSGVNFLMLDEPFNHLDIVSREKFEQALDNFEGTVVAVVHDRYFVEQFAHKIWALLDNQLKTFLDLADYERQSANYKFHHEDTMDRQDTANSR